MRPRSRFEIKYLIPHELKVAITRTVLAYTRLDRHARTGGSYPVRSLYFDTARFHAYHEKIDGLLNRSKFRVRTYGNTAEALFLEHKERFNNRILKRRDPLSEEAYRVLLRGIRPGPDETGEAWQAFWAHGALAHLKPVLCIDYQRKSLVGKTDPRLRVTMDQELTVRRARNLEESTTLFPVLSKRDCVLEIKFNDRCPVWVKHLAHTYSLQDQAYSKYCMGLQVLAKRGALHLE